MDIRWESLGSQRRAAFQRRPYNGPPGVDRDGKNWVGLQGIRKGYASYLYPTVICHGLYLPSGLRCVYWLFVASMFQLSHHFEGVKGAVTEINSLQQRNVEMYCQEKIEMSPQSFWKGCRRSIQKRLCLIEVKRPPNLISSKPSIWLNYNKS